MKTFANRKRLQNSKQKRYLKKQKRNHKNKEKLLLRSRWKLRNRIQKMPPDIQKKLCIWTWRLYWRDFVPITAKIPSWMHFQAFQQRQLWEARLRNIHFLHLPMNTLPENKKWIMGCQCNFCVSTKEPSQYKQINQVLDHLEGIKHFSLTVPQETVGYWNCRYYLSGKIVDDKSHRMKIFDPLCGTLYEDLPSSHLRMGIPIEFNL